jgi:hypothetical protein
MPSLRRALYAAGLGAAALALTACQKPLPQLTVLSGATTIRVAPQTYCFSALHCHFPRSAVGSIHAPAGSSLVVDVPRPVAAGPWSVVSAVQNKKGQFQTIKGANYQSGTQRNSHTARVDVPYGVGNYYLVVTQRSSASTGSWVAQITITR